MAGNPRLSLRLLGTPRLYWDDRPLNIQRLQVRAIIYFLACQTSMIGRSDIILLFWPDEESEKARRNLRDLLSKLRSELPDSSLLVSDRDFLMLDRERVFVDVQVFEEIYEQLNLPFLLPEDRPLPDPIYQKLIYALKLWDAPRFLYGARAFKNQEFEEWVTETGKGLQKKRLVLMTRLARHYMVVGDFEGALDLLDEIIAEDEYLEHNAAVYFRLECLLRLDRIAQAYDYIQDINSIYLIEDFGRLARPLETLIQKIVLAREQGPTEINISPLPDQRAEVPFVGQQEEINELRRLSQRGGIAVLKGDAGSGKTRIIQEFLQQVTNSPRVFRAQAMDMEQDLPFHPIFESLRLEISTSEWQKLERFWLSQLVPYMPEIGHAQGVSTPGYQGLMENTRRAVFEALYQVLRLAIGQRRLILILDDAQWADADTIALLAYLIQRKLFKEHGLLVVAYRTDEVNTELVRLSENPQWLDQIVELEVPALNLDEIGTVARNFFRRSVSAKAVHQLRDATGGNPLFVIETLRVIQELSMRDHPENGWQRIPLSGVLHALVRSRLDHLTANASQVLVCAAVIGKNFSFHLAQAASGLSTEALSAALDELEKHRLILVIPQLYDTNRYVFSQGLLREVAALELSATRRMVVHTRLAEALIEDLQTHSQPELAARIAFHLAEAGDGKQAFDYWLAAAAERLEKFDWRGASEAYYQAQQLAGVMQMELDDERLYRLYIGWGTEALNRYDLESATNSLKRAVLEGQRRNSALLLGSGLSAQGLLFFYQGLYTQALLMIDNALASLNHGPFHEYVTAHNRKALIYLNQTNLGMAAIQLKNVLAQQDRARERRDHLALAETRYFLSVVLNLSGELQEAGQLAREGLSTAQKYEVYELQFRLEMALGYAEFNQGNMPAALQHFQNSLNLADTYYAWHFVLENLSLSAQADFAMGRLFQADLHLKNAMRLADMNQYMGKHGALLCTQGKIALCAGQLEKAVQVFDAALRKSSSKFDVIDNLHYLGWSMFLAGEKDAGMLHLNTAIQEAQMSKLSQRELETRAHLALLNYFSGDVEDALVELAEVTNETHNCGFAASGTALSYVEACEALRKGDKEQAQHNIQSLLNTAEREANPWLRLHALDLSMQLAEIDGEPVDKIRKRMKNEVNNLLQGIDAERKSDFQFSKTCCFVLK